MKFVIRDDDTCGFTSPGEILACYESLWSDIPVSLSVTPFRVPGNDRNAPPLYKGSMEALPLERNKELVDFLREGTEDGRLDITLHGYHHWRCRGLPEFVAGDGLQEKASKGKSYLNDLLNVDIRRTAGRNNSISRNGLSAIIEAGMNLAGTVRLWSPAARRVTLGSLAKYPSVWWHQHVRGRHYPFVLDLGDHEEVSCHTVGPRSVFGLLRKELDYCYQLDGVFVLATHYHAFERQTQDGYTVGKVVNELVDIAAGFPRVEFVGLNAIWKGRTK